MSKDANSFGHDKALAWESRGFVYTKRGCIVSTHPLSCGDPLGARTQDPNIKSVVLYLLS